MVDDILLSPEEQDERAKRWLKENGLALVVGVTLGLAAVFGYNSYKDYQVRSAERASALYDAVLSAVKQSELTDIEERVQELKKDHAGSSYAAKAALLLARQLSVSDLDAALGELKWVAENADEKGLHHTARIRQAKILIAQGDLTSAGAVASREPYDGFDSYYQEILGDIAAQQQAFEPARLHYQSALDALGSADNGYRAVLTLKMNRLPAANTVEQVPANSPENENKAGDVR